MSHQTNDKEYGQPCATSGGTKTVTEIHDGIYGEYDPEELEPKATNPAEKLNPNPFTLKEG